MAGLRIAYLVDKAAPFFVGGYEVRAFELSKALAERHEVRIYTSLPHECAHVMGVDYRRVAPTVFQSKRSGGRSLPHSALFALSLRKNPFEDWNPDVVIVEAIPYLQLVTSRGWLSDLSCPRVLTVDEAWNTYSYLTGLLAWPSREFVRRSLEIGISLSDMIIAISRITAQSLKTNYHAQKITVVPMGVHIDKLLQYRSSQGDSKTYDFVYLGRLVKMKRIKDLIVALGILKQSFGWDGRAAIIGDGPLRRDLIARADGLGLSKNVDFLGFLSEHEKYSIMRESKVFALPSEREGFSMSALEAISLGIPAVVAVPPQPEVFGTSDFVIDGQTGLHYPVGDCELLAASLWRISNDGVAWLNMRRNALSVASDYDWVKIAGGLENLLVDLVDGKHQNADQL